MTSPPSFHFKPLGEHIDDGFGATADAFFQAAKMLEKDEDSTAFLHASLPICFLYRHAVELYLKSLVVVIHRCLQLPYGDDQHSESPMILKGNKWVPINHVHSVVELYGYLNELLDANMARLVELSETDWRDWPDDLADAVGTIEEVDRSSTFFRYPGEGNLNKSDFHESSVRDIWASLGPDDPPTKAFIEVDENDKVIAAYKIEPSGLDWVREPLRKAAEHLSVLHFAFRCDLAGGR